MPDRNPTVPKNKITLKLKRKNACRIRTKKVYYNVVNWHRFDAYPDPVPTPGFYTCGK